MQIRPVGRFPKEQRIRRSAEYRTLRAHSGRVVTAHFVLFIGPQPPADEDSAAADSSAKEARPPRLGIVVSRRRGNAVARNRAKRLIREAFRATRSLWPAEIDLVVLVRAPLGQMRLQDVVGQWQRVGARIAREARRALGDLQS